ncbi:MULTISPECIES: pyridoxamine 5'-phosphate oxidase [Rhodanobacteraceae]|uniref:pyridoxamine 5'-phosphate oxidase n=1 Tax=Rhodanobacteraceae TaxID=1775411 RepID=UPI00087E64DB|nr:MULTISPECIES: pyridoxamine 5'-phosphate oxidase [Rhodanobacteraceae]SDG79679.1 Pyridoxamine 5'-phosphate oxidase [Dyella sp. 333MFSha]SKB42394.1 Pyridoxamine 5'-phosphate oxidase [Luteibacter sp. 22Crub2.1]
MLTSDILDTFRGLLDEAKASGDREPTAMNLATSDASGRVHSRIVLLKGIDEHGLRFHTNRESAKGREIAEHPQVALCFHWKQIREGVQVRFEGRVQRLDDAESDAYFASRPRGSQIGAWASKQSQTLPDRHTFEERVAHFEQEFAGRDVPRPPHWGGYLVKPDRVEFWYGATFRLHERIVHDEDDARWSTRMLYP